MGITSEDENIHLNYIVLVRSLQNRRVLFSSTDDIDGTPSKACKNFARDAVSRLAKAKTVGVPNSSK